ncbi:MAG: hypothetical protein ACOC5B_00790 [Myxococcota bacterium]
MERCVSGTLAGRQSHSVQRTGGSLPADIGDLIALETLYLSDNALTGS